MIADHQTNTVYFSNLTPEECPEEMKALDRILVDAGYKSRLLVETDDYYCRDYMPVQIARDHFVQFVFRPVSYFSRQEYGLISHPVYVELMNRIRQPHYSPVILDGGNVVKWEDKVILTDKVLSDNAYQFGSSAAIIDQLERDLQCHVLIIPSYPKEETGHADGMIRFIDGNTVFINEPDPKHRKWEEAFRNKLSKEFGLDYVELPCPIEANQSTANGLYLNYLHVGNLVVVPQFGLPEDGSVLHQLREIFEPKNFRVEPFMATCIAKYGGVLNCASWTIFE